MWFARLACPRDSGKQAPRIPPAFTLRVLPGLVGALPTLLHECIFFHLLPVSWELVQTRHTPMGSLLSWLSFFSVALTGSWETGDEHYAQLVTLSTAPFVFFVKTQCVVLIKVS